MMMSSNVLRGRALKLRSCALAATAACALLAAAPPITSAERGPEVPTLDWQPCGQAANVTCTTVAVPRDYDYPRRASLELFVAKSPATDQAHKIGSLFINFGGPGGSTADAVRNRGCRRGCAARRRYRSSSNSIVRATSADAVGSASQR